MIAKKLKVGDPIIWDCRRLDLDGEPVSVTGTPIASTLRHKIYPDEVITLTATAGQGENFTLRASKADTLGKRSGEYTWDVEFGDSESDDGSTPNYAVFLEPDNTTPSE